MKLRAKIQVGHYPYMNAITSHLASGNPAINTLRYINCVKDGITHNKFGDNSTSPLNGARLFLPCSLQL